MEGKETVLFSDYGIEIIRKRDAIYIRYDAGEIVPRFVESRITEEEFYKAIKSPQDAYEVILSIQERKSNP